MRTLKKSGRALLPNRLTWIDETNRGDHWYLEDGDRCLFFGEYFAGMSYRGGDTNQLIFNFKCPPSTAAMNIGRGNWKIRAINEISAAIRSAVGKKNAEELTWVPVPPSKAVGHADYDDRLSRTLEKAFLGFDADVRLLLRQTTSTKSDHDSQERLTPEELLAITELNRDALNSRPIGRGIVLFDDVLASGKHFKCCEARLRDVVPADTPIIGVFVARSVRPNPFDDFDDLSEQM